MNDFDNEILPTDPDEGEEITERVAGRETYEWVRSLVGAVLVITLLFTFVVRLMGVDGHSMVPTLQDGDRLIDAVEHHDARLARRQIVKVGIAARPRAARVADLAHRIHAADLGGDHAARFCHVSGEPAQTFQLHDRFPLTSFSKNRDG